MNKFPVRMKWLKTRVLSLSVLFCLELQSSCKNSLVTTAFLLGKTTPAKAQGFFFFFAGTNQQTKTNALEGRKYVALEKDGHYTKAMCSQNSPTI